MPRDINPNRLNIYTCSKCGGHIVTRDVDEGTTPFLVRCEATYQCDGKMASSFYRVFDPEGIMKHTHEWYKPAVIINMSPMTIEHIRKGGLILRRVAFTHGQSWQPTHKHVKTGGVYRVVDEAKMQTSDWLDGTPPEREAGNLMSVDMREVVIYEAQDGTKWVRPKEEFNDGRFQEIEG